MHQSSHQRGASTLLRMAQVIVVILALAALAIASSMLVTAGDQIAAFEPSEQTMPHPGPTAPPPPTI